MIKGLLGIVLGFVLLYLGIEAEIGMMAIFGGFFLLAGCVSLGLNLGESSNKKSKTQTSSANKTPPRSAKPQQAPAVKPKVSPVQPQPVPPTPGRQPDPPVVKPQVSPGVKPQPASAAPAVRRCKHCGAAVAQDDYYCIECGYPA